MKSLFRKIRQTAEMVKFSHSIFALPFALASMLIAAGGIPPGRLVFLVIMAMVTARNAGMSFNRWLDASIDAKNPRTASRHIPRGLLSPGFVLAFSIVNAALFVWVASRINMLCFWLSFPTLGVLFFYSHTKRFTSLSHLVLGLALGMSPIGAWIAVTGTLAFAPVLLGVAVVFWVAGFDMIYATQDYDFDRKEGLHSLVVRLGLKNALRVARVFHAATVVLLLLFGNLLSLGWPYFLTWVLISLLFLYEHSLVKADNLSRINAAFFNVNGFISILFLAGVILS